MKNRIVSSLLFIAYVGMLVKVMVFKSLPTIRVGQLMLNFAGTDAGHGPNFIPFATIVPYLLGSKGLIIGGINIVGNIALLVPLGFLAPLAYPQMTWKKSLVLAVLSGLCIETMQTVLKVGIFDIDDVILNALGVMLGYAACKLLLKWLRERKYLYISIAALLAVAAAAAAFYIVYPWGQPLRSDIGAGDTTSLGGQEGTMPTSGDLCGGTGGIGKVASIGDNSFSLRRNSDGRSQTVILASDASIQTSAGPAALSDLKVGDAVTLVGGPNPDGSFTADTVVVCKGASASQGNAPYQSGVKGAVSLGPTCPMMRNPPDPGCEDKGYQTTVSAYAANRATALATTRSAADGSFILPLPPGAYRIEAAGGSVLPRCAAADVVVSPSAYVVQNISCDTGIR